MSIWTILEVLHVSMRTDAGHGRGSSVVKLIVVSKFVK